MSFVPMHETERMRHRRQSTRAGHQLSPRRAVASGRGVEEPAIVAVARQRRGMVAVGAMIDPSTSGHYIGDCRELLAQLPDGCIQTCITSPPYWGLRDYGVDGQIGLEPTPEAYVAELVKVFAEVRRVLRDDGTLWLNLGDSYANGKVGRSDEDERSLRRRNQCWGTAKTPKSGSRADQGRRRRASDLKTKDLVGIPWEIAFALRADGWYLRCDIIWSKPNAMPESVTDRPTKAHEYLFLLSKREKYFYDADAIKEPVTGGSHPRGHGVNPKARHDAAGSKQNRSFSAAVTG